MDNTTDSKPPQRPTVEFVSNTGGKYQHYSFLTMPDVQHVSELISKNSSVFGNTDEKTGGIKALAPSNTVYMKLVKRLVTKVHGMDYDQKYVDEQVNAREIIELGQKLLSLYHEAYKDLHGVDPDDKEAKKNTKLTDTTE